MAVRQASTVAMQMPSAAQVTQVTLSPTSLCHYITDDELESLSEMQQDPVKDIFLAAVGGLIGAIVPAFDGLIRFENAYHPMTKTDLVSMFLASATFAVAIVTGMLWQRRTKGKLKAVESIRNRPKVQVVRT